MLKFNRILYCCFIGIVLVAAVVILTVFIAIDQTNALNGTDNLDQTCFSHSPDRDFIIIGLY